MDRLLKEAFIFSFLFFFLLVVKSQTSSCNSQEVTFIIFSKGPSQKRKMLKENLPTRESDDQAVGFLGIDCHIECLTCHANTYPTRSFGQGC